MMSSLTKRRTYAAAGTFMAIFVLGIVAGIFAQYDANWQLLDPGNVLSLTYDLIFGIEIPAGIDQGMIPLIAAAMTLVPLFVAYYQIVRKGVGK
jgi:hypothetical protein